jgi:hypothetical protein
MNRAEQVVGVAGTPSSRRAKQQHQRGPNGVERSSSRSRGGGYNANALHGSLSSADSSSLNFAASSRQTSPLLAPHMRTPMSARAGGGMAAMTPRSRPRRNYARAFDDDVGGADDDPDDDDQSVGLHPLYQEPFCAVAAVAEAGSPVPDVVSSQQTAKSANNREATLQLVRKGKQNLAGSLLRAIDL